MTEEDSCVLPHSSGLLRRPQMITRQSMASSYWPTDHTIRFPLHHSLMSETGPPLSPTWRTLRNHHHCHVYCQTGVIACNAESAASWESTSRAAWRKLTLKDVKNRMRDLTSHRVCSDWNHEWAIVCVSVCICWLVAWKKYVGQCQVSFALVSSDSHKSLQKPFKSTFVYGL